MISLSVCMIVKNEEEVLGRALGCLKEIADEIIIVDTGSSDKTKEIAKKFTDKIYDFTWCDDFAKARNYSFSKATKEYIMWLDADDVILEGDRQKLIKLKEEINPENVDMIMLKYNIGMDKNNNPTLSYYRERILKRSKNYEWISPIHEVIVPSGNIIYKDIAITHRKNKKSDPTRNIRIFKKMQKEGLKLDARQKFYFARELYYNKEYEASEKMYQDFFNSKDAWIENKINACLDLSNLYMLLNEDEKRLMTLFKSFEYDKPRAEICCAIANYFFEKEKYEISIYWYKCALNIVPNIEGGGFYTPDCYNFIPCIQLCVCYDKLGDYKLANEYNEMAGKYKPDNINYINNKKYFEKKKIL